MTASLAGCDLVLAVCTRDRPAELERLLTSLTASPVDDRTGVLVVDAGTDDAAERVAADSGLRCVHVRARRPGLTRQRNEALELLQEVSPAVVCFLDDDVVVQRGFVAALRAAFTSAPTAAAVGGVVLDEPPVRWRGLKTALGLWSRTPGAVLPSGRNVVGHFDEGPAVRPVQWLSGCCMAYRYDVVRDRRFDDRLEGYSWGEDVDFSFRLGSDLGLGSLQVHRSVRVEHRQAPSHRLRDKELARQRTFLRWRWVRENASRGLSVPAFWRAFASELLLTCVRGLVDNRQRAAVPGLLAGVRDVARARRGG